MLSQVAQGESQVHFRVHQFLARENEAPDAMLYIQEGWACRYRLLSDGRRQITALYLPGDYCDPQWVLGGLTSQPIVAITNVRALRLPCKPPAYASMDGQQGFWLSLSDMIERQSAWLVTLGCMTAMERVAHLLVELFERMRKAGLAYGQQCAMPLTQIEIADMTGLTPVHVNRTLQSMRAKGLIELQSKWLRIPELHALREAAAMTGQLSAI
ncbi:Crp/Fnr family transcriptional regulator [Sphingobium sp.]|uniref:Crp/Fnr family transcriptional regulator n=1 Tax=Sphingobium sp. TaxID=1912891 RepID=UPI002CA68875|nr:Crp/Fnr family transcriptional regulator [Sphingobium sp.]HUD93359.1 Crp/Fnr family transcriptional regulator [Sphingobium sp.]